MRQDIGGMREDIGGMRQDIAGIRQVMVTRSDFEAESADLKDELLKALSGIANQQASFVTLLTRLLNEREEADRRFARLEAAVFGSKH